MSNRESANRRNAKKSTGPNDTTNTRLNATKHGLLSVGVTELDDAEGYHSLLRDLIAEKNPQGPTETFLVRCIVLCMVRLQRAKRLEAEFITEVLHPTIHAPNPLSAFDLSGMGAVIDPGLPSTMPYERVDVLVKIYQRYQSSIALDLFRLLHELERAQRMRKGEQVPAPAVVEVTVSTHSSNSDEPFQKVILEGSVSTESNKQEDSNPGPAAGKDEAADPPVEPPVED